MKALILAAGFGTRLKPHTDRLPKPLFPIDGTPILELAIQRLISAGCTGIAINTHHLHDRIEDYIGGRSYPVPVTTHYEPVILDTGGAIRNVRTLLDDAPFLVINSDIVTNLNYAQVYHAHLQHPHPVTLVLHDCPEFNNVTCDPEGFVLGFHLTEKPFNAVPDLAFTGIQVLDPSVIDLIPGDGPYSSIDLYRQLIARGPSVKSLVVRNHYWIDIGSPAKYATACRDLTAPRIFRETFGVDPGMDFAVTHLSGDGSDRAFYRLQTADRSMILSDHGITLTPDKTEASSFVRIGLHLRSKALPVPRILGSDLISGHVYLDRKSVV
jgi:NDP-sugar pyrophosphorylase family protein